MPTDKPRVTITMTEDQLVQIENYRFGHKFKNQTQAILSLIQKGFDELARTGDEMSLNFDSSNKLSKDESHLLDGYRNLSSAGKRSLRAQLKMHLTEFPAEQPPEVIEVPYAARGQGSPGVLRLTPAQVEKILNAEKIKSDDEI